ncbi:hypothetical protein FRC12_007500 [Ceratobasidium sp. 428]|nr:hypothetical protein FRC12_007500 [Ceratobasidium sp. 428]
MIEAVLFAGKEMNVRQGDFKPTRHLQLCALEIQIGSLDCWNECKFYNTTCGSSFLSGKTNIGFCTRILSGTFEFLVVAPLTSTSSNLLIIFFDVRLSPPSPCCRYPPLRRVFSIREARLPTMTMAGTPKGVQLRKRRTQRGEGG